MSIQLINKNHYETLLYLFENAEKEIKIISPFIKEETAGLLCRVLKGNPELKGTIITRFVRQEFVDRVSSLNALRDLLKCEVRLYALQHLHAKLYLIDDHIALIGSANLTTGGFKFNHELSILMEDEKNIISELNQYFYDILEEIKPQPDGGINLSLIDTEQDSIEKIMKNWTNKDSKYYFDKCYQHGAIITKVKKETERPTEDKIQEILCCGYKETGTQYWIKFEGTAEERKNPHEQYSPYTPQGYPDGITCFPAKKRPTGIQNGDQMFLSVITTDAKGNKTPVIIGRCSTFGFEEENIATDDMKKETKWLERFPSFLRLKNVEFLLTSQKNGISLIHLLTTLNTDLYPTTSGIDKSYPELRTLSALTYKNYRKSCQLHQ